MPKRVAAAAFLAVAAVLAAGCGGSSDSSSSDTTPTAKWADSLCSSITTYKESLTSAFDTLKAGDLSKDSISSAVDDAKAATETFTSSLQDLGRPDTESGQQAQDAVNELSTEIQTDMQKIEDAVDNASGIAGLLAAAPEIQSTLSSAGTQISDTLSSFQDLDAKGELESAFKDSDSCQALTNGS